MSQITVRLINFGLNLVTARLLSPEAYGVRKQAAVQEENLFRQYSRLTVASAVQLASVQFHLLNTGIVSLSREGLKRACQRIQKVKPASAAAHIICCVSIHVNWSDSAEAKCRMILFTQQRCWPWAPCASHWELVSQLQSAQQYCGA